MDFYQDRLGLDWLDWGRYERALGGKWFRET